MRTTLWTTAAAAVLLLASLSMVLGCPAPADNPLGLTLSDPAHAPVFDIQHQHAAISIKQGQEFVIKLDSNPTTGYTWMLKEDKVRQAAAAARARGTNLRPTDDEG